jgi:glutamate/tyrosine decarboxylase-like PLP-dependent enzyme
MLDTPFQPLRRALQHAEAYLASLDQRSVAATSSLSDLRRRLDVQWGERGRDPVQVVDELVAAVDGGLLGSAGGRFFAWVIGGALPAALAADWLTSTWDQNAALHACSPAACVAEEVAGKWLKEALDLPRDASFAFTTGCQLAHFVGLAAGRHAVLRDAGWNLEADGLFGAPPVRVLISNERHGSIDRALRSLGFGRRQVIEMETDESGRIRESTLRQALDAGAAPTIVVLSAGDINTAAFDPFSKLIPLAHARGAWVHVDGAFGLIARASPSKRRLLDGVEAADSWATDAHKWINVPYDCGVAFVRDSAAHRSAMTIRADYIEASTAARDPIDWTPEWSRRGRGLAVYAALRELGRAGLAELVDRSCDHACALVNGLGELADTQVLCRPILNQGLVRFLDARPGASESDHDARTDAVIRAVNATGEAFFSGTTWRGRRAMRISVVNWRTSDRDIERSLAAFADAARHLDQVRR